jgi:hypothetical protein
MTVSKFLFAFSALSSIASADTTAVIRFDSGSYSDFYFGAPAVQVQGNIVRGEWVKIEYPAKRIENLVLGLVYGSWHCYGYGPSCSPRANSIETFYRFGYEGSFTKAQGEYIQIPQDAAKLEVYFFAPHVETEVGYYGTSEIRSNGAIYDSRGGQNYSFNF